jgi:RimJ/RimL family protein N-acetyltransferase
MIPTLETARLILRPVSLDDAPQVQAIFPQWEIVRYLANQVPWPWQGKGLMMEACDRVTDFWFTVLECQVLRVPKAVDNTGSRRISEKQGMRVVALEDRDYVCGRLPSEIWEITQEEWLARKRK